MCLPPELPRIILTAVESRDLKYAVDGGDKVDGQNLSNYTTTLSRWWSITNAALPRAFACQKDDDTLEREEELTSYYLLPSARLLRLR